MSTIEFDPKELIWAQKYRPRTLDDVILPQRIKTEFRLAMEKGDSQNLILSGPAGTGKTTSALVMANELGASVMFINASLETSIDVIRTRVLEFSTTRSAFAKGGRKIVILDEFEQMSQLAQNAIKSFSEQFSKNVFFIFTTNHPNKIIDPIHSRCNHVEFKIKPEEKQDIVREMVLRSKQVLDNENIKYDVKLLAQVVLQKFPDMRKVLNSLQSASGTGELLSTALKNEAKYSELISAIKDKKWQVMRQWVADFETEFEFRTFYDELSKCVPEEMLPSIIVLTSEYQYKIGFVVDKSITISAYLTEIMGEL